MSTGDLLNGLSVVTNLCALYLLTNGKTAEQLRYGKQIAIFGTALAMWLTIEAHGPWGIIVQNAITIVFLLIGLYRGDCE